MKIEVKRSISGSVSIAIIDGGTTLSLGDFLDNHKRDELAKQFLDAVYAMGPMWTADCTQWFGDMVKETGIKL